MRLDSPIHRGRPPHLDHDPDASEQISILTGFA
jgi:hypothetical protein